MSPARALIGLVWLLGLGGCPAPGPVAPPDPIRQPARPKAEAHGLTIAYQANLLGEIEPCG